MTKQQQIKSEWLRRSGYIRYSIISMYALSENDKKRSEMLLNMMPEDTIAEDEIQRVIQGFEDRNGKRYLELLRLYETARNETETAIARLENCEYQGILAAHYLDGQTWNTIARVFGCSPRTIKYKHIKALDMLDI